MRILAVSTLTLLLALAGCSKTESEAPAAKAEPAAPKVVAQAEAKSVESQPAEAKTEAAKPAEEAPAAADSHADHDHSQAAESAAPDNAQYVEGTHYERLAQPVPTITGDKIEVTEVFSYGCIHCFHFEPVAKNWRAHMPDGVEFVQNPAVFNPSWAHYARIYFTAKALDVLDPVHDEVFKAIHVGRQRLMKPAEVAAIFKTAGIDEQTFNDTWESFGVSSQVQQADSRARGFGTAGTPELIINGEYRVTAGMAGTHANMFKVTNFLIDKIKSEG